MLWPDPLLQVCWSLLLANSSASMYGKQVMRVG